MDNLKESLDFALQSAGMGTWDIDLLTNTVQCSQEMLDLWEVKAEEFNGQRSLLQKKVHPDDVEKMRLAIDRAIKNRCIYELEYRIILKNENLRWVKSRGRCTYSPQSDEPVRFSGVVFDITETKDKEIALEAALRERERFLTVASHELKTPVTCLQLQLQVMESVLKEQQKGVLSSERLESGLKKQKEQISRLARIIDNIFHQSEVSDGSFYLRKESFDLIPMLSEVTERFKVSKSLAPDEISLVKRKDSIKGTWDRSRLEQVIINLLSNAHKYGNQRPIIIEVGEESDQAFIKLRDEGQGIKPEEHQKIFEKFGHSSINNEMTGLGLGLFLSKNIVLSHGGKILLNSEPGKGSEFTVILPVRA